VSAPPVRGTASGTVRGAAPLSSALADEGSGGGGASKPAGDAADGGCDTDRVEPNGEPGAARFAIDSGLVSANPAPKRESVLGTRFCVRLNAAAEILPPAPESTGEEGREPPGGEASADGFVQEGAGESVFVGVGYSGGVWNGVPIELDGDRFGRGRLIAGGGGKG
jgi:hypothetical protein